VEFILAQPALAAMALCELLSPLIARFCLSSSTMSDAEGVFLLLIPVRIY
tara:strand:- start:942 stop:1091 length:150 start_codon:yes stop_codon:yes gene_type:complete